MNDISRGDSLYNRAINKSGVVLDATDDNAILVITVTGKESWDIKCCDVVENID